MTTTNLALAQAALPVATATPADSTTTAFAYAVIGLPLVGATLLLLGGKATNRWGHFVGLAAAVGAFASGLKLLVDMLARPVAERAVVTSLYDWMSITGLDTNLALRVDQLSILFVLLITGVGSLIHLYSVGYMAHDPNRRRFFAYLNLFLASMLTLVLGSSYLVLFFGWEGVGLCSYLLIGFWFQRPAAARAGNKAFIMNRIGDVGMVLGISTMFALFGSTDFDVVNAGAPEQSAGWITFLGFALLVGACAKSAQVPLQAWLLDAMEGPTPVSALIHAATMVTAGVYLVVRAGTIYQNSAVATTAVVVVGTVTLLVGAWIGCAKDDIKKVLAGSTMSQIGYMILAAGIGPAGYALAIFHLLTHGFFKANMFLGAGSIMHAMNDGVDMRRFGALRAAMPWTFITFAAGYLAIIGFPGFAGFYSKDAIIEAAFAHNGLVGFAALLGAGVTAFYMTRLMIMTFFGQRRWLADVHPHESGASMVAPLVILAALSVAAGAWLAGSITGWLNPAVGGNAHELHLVHLTPLTFATLGVVAAGVIAAVLVFRGEIATERTAAPLYTRIGDNAFYGDAINRALVVAPTASLAHGIDVLDNEGLSPGSRGAGAGVAAASRAWARLETGYVRAYGLLLVAGTALLTTIVVVLTV